MLMVSVVFPGQPRSQALLSSFSRLFYNVQKKTAGQKSLGRRLFPGVVRVSSYPR